jgi:cytidylate kinase
LSFSLPSIIAIDGPAASGKSTVGSLLAERLGYVYFDTGVMYRAVTWIALQRGIPIADEARVSALAEAIHIEVLRPTVDDGRQYTVLVDGQDVTWNLRRPGVDRGVSPVSAYAGVRCALTAQQRRLGLQGGIVMVGRDIGTVVLPEADLKIYLDATVDERARRRWKELQLRDSSTSLDEVLAAMERRDEIDSSRALAPLRPAEDAHLLDTTGLSVEQVLDRIEAWVCEAAEEE